MAVDMERRKRLHIDWGINPAYILFLLSAIWVTLTWAGDINKGQAVQDTKIETVVKKVENIENKMDAKMDRIIEYLERSKK
jgi:hypothetical protein